MSKKKRFRRKSLGRINMFFKLNPYTGHSPVCLHHQKSEICINTPHNLVSAVHYSKCYKKKNYLPQPLDLLVSLQFLIFIKSKIKFNWN